jgi:hypothetical protein
MDAAIRCADICAVGLFLFRAGWIVVSFANSGAIIADSLMIILGEEILIAGLLAVTKSEMDALSARVDALSHEIDVLIEQRKSR